MERTQEHSNPEKKLEHDTLHVVPNQGCQPKKLINCYLSFIVLIGNQMSASVKLYLIRCLDLLI